MTSEVLIRFMQGLIEYMRRRVFLVLNNQRVNQSQVIQASLEEHQAQIEVLYLTVNSPELYVDEFMNGDLKKKMSTSEPTWGVAHLQIRRLPPLSFYDDSVAIADHAAGYNAGIDSNRGEGSPSKWHHHAILQNTFVHYIKIAGQITLR